MQTRKEIVMVIYLSDDLCFGLLYATTGSNLVGTYFFRIGKMYNNMFFSSAILVVHV